MMNDDPTYTRDQITDAVRHLNPPGKIGTVIVKI
jgi:hypothetical protein